MLPPDTAPERVTHRIAYTLKADSELALMVGSLEVNAPEVTIKHRPAGARLHRSGAANEGEIMTHSLNLRILMVFYGMIGWQLPAIAQTGGWTSQQYFDQRHQAWWVQASSTVPRVLALTVNWHGNRGNGRVHGSFVLVVPAYPGFGAPVTAHQGVPSVRNFGYTIVSN